MLRELRRLFRESVPPKRPGEVEDVDLSAEAPTRRKVLLRAPGVSLVLIHKTLLATLSASFAATLVLPLPGGL